MTKVNNFRKEVLFDTLKVTIATTQVSIYEGICDTSKIVLYTNYNVAIALKSFCSFNARKANYTSKEKALEAYKNIYFENYKDAQEDLADYLSFRDEYDLLSDDEKLIITAMLSLSSYFPNKSLNKIKNILKTYSFKLKNCIKNASKYYPAFDMAHFSYYTIECILFKFLVENS